MPGRQGFKPCLRQEAARQVADKAQPQADASEDDDDEEPPHPEDDHANML